MQLAFLVYVDTYCAISRSKYTKKEHRKKHRSKALIIVSTRRCKTPVNHDNVKVCENAMLTHNV